MLRRNACLFKPFESGARRTPAQAPFCLHSGTVGFHILQSTMAKTANYRVDVPRVLQRFSINFKPPDPGSGCVFFFIIAVCMQLCIHAICHSHVRVHLSRSAGVFIVTGLCFLLFIYFFFTFVCLWCARVCKFNAMLCQLKV